MAASSAVRRLLRIGIVCVGAVVGLAILLILIALIALVSGPVSGCYVPQYRQNDRSILQSSGANPRE